MAEFRPGDRCLVTEHDPETGGPREGARSFPALVERADGEYAQARLETGALWPFHQETGWSEIGGLRWRLAVAPE